MTKRALVVGVSGTLGSGVAAALIKKGYSVYGLSRFQTFGSADEVKARGVEPIAFDLSRDDPAQLPDVDVVFLEVWERAHLVGSDPDPQAIWDLNYTGVGRIVARYAGQAQFVNGCTGSVYGAADHAWRESDWPRPDIEYGISRLAQEKLINFLCAEKGSGCIHLRLYHANAPGKGLLHFTAQQLLAGEAIGMAPAQKVQVIALEDVIDMTVRSQALIKDEPQAINICHPHIWIWQELVERMAASLSVNNISWGDPHGSVEGSYYGSAELMQKTFGEPQFNIDAMIDAVCAHALS